MNDTDPDSGPRWQPISAIDRRVLGVLVEKAKTTPDVYPMSLNGVTTGANQKNNRYPLTNLQPDDVEMSLDRLRGLGAVALVEGSGRVQKFRHLAYDWLGVEKVELSVMVELLLRGAQTEGELRGRAARMDPIPDLAALRPVLDSLKAKGLILSLTPEGRGHVLSHALYMPNELERLRKEHSAAADAANAGVIRPEVNEVRATQPGATGGSPASAPPPRPAPIMAESPVPTSPDVRKEIESLRNEVAQLRSDFEDVTSQLHNVTQELQRLKDALGG